MVVARNCVLRAIDQLQAEMAHAFLEPQRLWPYSAEYRTATVIHSVAFCLGYGGDIITRSDCLFFFFFLQFGI